MKLITPKTGRPVFLSYYVATAQATEDESGSLDALTMISKSVELLNCPKSEGQALS